MTRIASAALGPTMTGRAAGSIRSTWIASSNPGEGQRFPFPDHFSDVLGGVTALLSRTCTLKRTVAVGELCVQTAAGPTDGVLPNEELWCHTNGRFGAMLQMSCRGAVRRLSALHYHATQTTA